MRRDAQLLLSNAQAITATADSTHVIDQGAVVDHVGVAFNIFGPESGKPRLVITIGTAPTAGTGIQAALHDCDTVNGVYSATGIGLVSAIPIAMLVAGYEMLNVLLPPGLRRFLKVVYTTTGVHTTSVGTVNAAIVVGSPTQNVVPFRA